MTTDSKKELTKTLWVSLCCLAVFNLALAMSAIWLSKSFKNFDPDTSGAPYFFAVFAELFIVYIASSKTMRHRFFTVNKRPSKQISFMAICLLGLTQIFFSINSDLLEAILNFFHLSAQAQVESATASSDTLSMFLYSALLAPIGEEILFRGYLLRNFQKLDERFAIIFSALLFGLYHGNIDQTPFAFVLGILLGYIAVNYGIYYSIALHIFNNMILGDFFSFVLDKLPDSLGNMLNSSVMLFLGICGCYFIYRYFERLKQQYLSTPPDWVLIRISLLNIPFLLFLAVALLEMITGLTTIK
ncbi:CPBP family intramembrane glutamic endopeptidase [Ligilactobacillus apodemi]|uniref:CAAX amino protease n=1 Tax=Ligilactobacillus apodemi DSM 16634 = JCM 16172 TaxID=1423724 RepID=A0A0R1U3F5_9LACO|nr:type II CAAX endopeptidase family protein [Ligilactobacillus apodemi]KRL87502.1 CAAX amino protease [Ligilactobacillus apodemi DSM 16634 = JCM 16172]MCR1901976.1 CPBP family intramembrane metalloprotease [Ligilactobacillus apodemi]